MGREPATKRPTYSSFRLTVRMQYRSVTSPKELDWAVTFSAQSKKESKLSRVTATASPW